MRFRRLRNVHMQCDKHINELVFTRNAFRAEADTLFANLRVLQRKRNEAEIGLAEFRRMLDAALDREGRNNAELHKAYQAIGILRKQLTEAGMEPRA